VPDAFFSLSCFHSSEENVWKLCEQVKKQNPNELSKCYAVFVSNERRTVPLWRQKAGRGEDKLVVWVSHKLFPFSPFPPPNRNNKNYPFTLPL
jgi:protein N-terminal glutamine amidohydrolase